jgi:voltage-gated potassium channel
VKNRDVLSPRRWARHALDLVLATEHLRRPLLLVFFLVIGATLGYMALLDLDFVDGLYQALNTLSTIGFREVAPFTTGAKIFTCFLIITGVGTLAYTLTLLVATVVEGEFRRNLRRRMMMRRIEAMSGHAVICGFGRVGAEIAHGFHERGKDFVVIDPDPAAVAAALERGYPVVPGSASDEPVLRAAGIERAASLLAAANSDAQNVWVVLTARKLGPNLFIVARSEVPSSDEKLRLAGADRVVSPHAISGRRMMLSAIQPLITDFVDTLAAGRNGEQILAELEVTPGSPLDGVTLARAFADAPGTTVLGIRHGDGRLQVGPRGETSLIVGDTVMVLADEAQIARLHGKRPSSRPRPVRPA